MPNYKATPVAVLLQLATSIRTLQLQGEYNCSALQLQGVAYFTYLSLSLSLYRYMRQVKDVGTRHSHSATNGSSNYRQRK